MKSWLKGGIVGGLIALIPLIIAFLILPSVKEECLGCIILLLPAALVIRIFADNFLPLSFPGKTFFVYISLIIFNLVLGFIIGAVIGLIAGKIKARKN